MRHLTNLVDLVVDQPILGHCFARLLRPDRFHLDADFPSSLVIPPRLAALLPYGLAPSALGYDPSWPEYRPYPCSFVRQVSIDQIHYVQRVRFVGAIGACNFHWPLSALASGAQSLGGTPHFSSLGSSALVPRACAEAHHSHHPLRSQSQVTTILLQYLATLRPKCHHLWPVPNCPKSQKT